MARVRETGVAVRYWSVRPAVWTLIVALGLSVIGRFSWTAVPVLFAAFAILRVLRHYRPFVSQFGWFTLFVLAIWSWVWQGPSVAWFAVLAAVVAVWVVRRQIISPKFRFIGVPRPDASHEPNDPLERTSDDAQRLVDAIDTLWGSTRPGGPRCALRASAHAGTGVEGKFHVAHESKVDMGFVNGGSAAVVARFSNFTGSIERDDAHRGPHGLAMHIDVQDAAGWDVVLVDITRFPVGTRDDFLGFLHRFGQWRRLATFLLAGRTSLLALKSLSPIWRPRSYATRTYHSLNTFMWDQQPVRLFAKPVKGARPVVDGSDARSRSGLGPDLRRAISNADLPPSWSDGDPRFRLDRDVRGRLSDGRIVFRALRRSWKWASGRSEVRCTLPLAEVVAEDEDRHRHVRSRARRRLHGATDLQPTSPADPDRAVARRDPDGAPSRLPGISSTKDAVMSSERVADTILLVDAVGSTVMGTELGHDRSESIMDREPKVHAVIVSDRRARCRG